MVNPDAARIPRRLFCCAIAFYRLTFKRIRQKQKQEAFVPEQQETKNQENILVLDTNVLLSNPNALEKNFKESRVIIPEIVLEELDNLKKDLRLGNRAHSVLRFLDKISKTGDFYEGIDTGHSIIEISNRLDDGTDKNDDEIVRTALIYQQLNPRAQVIFISNDKLVRIKARLKGVTAGSYMPLLHEENGGYDAEDIISASDEDLIHFHTHKTLALDVPVLPNRIYELISLKDPDVRIAVLSDKTGASLRSIPCPDKKILAINPRDDRQAAAFASLLDPQIDIVFLLGVAGTGKTLLALAAAMQMMNVPGTFEGIVLARPQIPFRKDFELGFNPGTEAEKLAPMMKSFWHVLKLVARRNAAEKQKTRPDHQLVRELIEKYEIEFENLANIEGITYHRKLIVLDEAQKADAGVVKEFISRAGPGTKVVISGNPKQNFLPYEGEHSNGLAYAAMRLAREPNVSVIHLKKVFRSRAAELAVNLL